MPDQEQDNFLNDLFNIIGSSIHRRRSRERVVGPRGPQNTRQITDATGLDDNYESQNDVCDEIYIYSCGHASNIPTGGTCHYCDQIVCQHCIHICSSCGCAACNLHKVTANFDGSEKPFCRNCAAEIRRSIRFKKVVRKIVSFFISEEN